MVADVRYLFGDLRTNEIIAEIPCQGVTVSDSLEGGEFRASFGLDLTGIRNDDTVSATLPGKSFAVVERNGVPIWGGIVWSRTYQSQAKISQVYCKTMDQYSSKRFIDTDYTFTNVEQRNVFRALFAQMQADPYSPQVVLPSTFPTVAPITGSISGAELRSYRDVFDQISTADGGFEWRINIGRSSNQYTWTLQIGYPVIGMPWLPSSTVFEYPGSVLNYWRNDTIGGAGTNIYGVGSGEGQDMVQVEVIHQDLLDGGFPRYDQQVTFKSIDNEAALEAVTQVQASIRKAPMPVYTVELKADRDPKFGEWVIGDYATLSFKDPMHPGAGLNHPARILKWDYTPPSSDGTEEVRVTFEGEDAGD